MYLTLERTKFILVFYLFRTVAPSNPNTPSTSSGVPHPVPPNTNYPTVERVLREHDFSATYTPLRNDHASNAAIPLATVYNDHAYATTQYPNKN